MGQRAPSVLLGEPAPSPAPPEADLRPSGTPDRIGTFSLSPGARGGSQPESKLGGTSRPGEADVSLRQAPPTNVNRLVK